MSLETTTESLCDQLKKFVAEEMEEKRIRKERMKEFNENSLIVFSVIGLVILGILVLTALGFLFYYLWICWKSRRAGPITQIPKSPISNKNLLEYRSNEIIKANVYYDSKSYLYNRCTGKLKKIIRVVFDLTEDTTVYLSNQTRIISIRMNGFKNGVEFHSFEPADGVIQGSYFTYQMFGDDTIQVTRYIVGSKSYVAGFCIYVKNRSVGDNDINMNIIKKLMKEAKYPGKEAVEKEVKEELEKMKDCNDSVFLKFAFWKRTQRHGPKTEGNDVPPSYSSLSIA